MPETKVRIAPDLAFPIEVVTETILILGKRGAGKTSTGVVLTEEMVTAGQTVCVVDPAGAWWGLRSSADGEGPGLPVTILGGEHGDLPLPDTAGAAAADLVVDERLPIVLDLSLMSKSKQRKFMTDFLERLYHRNRDPLHLVIDEADLFAPQRATAEIARLLGAYEDVVRRGRNRGIGSTSITQRPAGMNTDIRSQPEVLITMRLIGKHDIVAIDEWIRTHASDEDARELKASLPSLPVGTAWVWSPGWLEILAKVAIRPRLTFDSSATPKVGQQRIVPRAFAPVDPADLERLATRLGENSPGEPPPSGPDAASAAQLRRLSAENRALRAELAAALQRPAERIEVPVIPDGDLAVLQQVAERITTAIGEAQARATSGIAAPTARPAGQPAAAPPRVAAGERASRAGRAPPAPGGPEQAEALAQAPKLKSGARNMLAQLARSHPLKLTRTQLAGLARIKGSGSTFTSYLSSLRLNGYVVAEGNLVLITPKGLAAAGVGADEPPMTAEEIREQWRNVLKLGARTMLDHLLERYPKPVPRLELAEHAGINPAGSTLTSYLSTLRTNNLIEETSEGIRAADVFFLGSAGQNEKG